MRVRVDRITINREGPLAQDFELRCGDLNLIYGGNETGKSYLVECLIRCLFRTSSDALRSWSLREWQPRARVVISGLTENPMQMRPETSEKLDACWELDDSRLAIHLSHLLVVQEGQTWLNELGNHDGVGLELLKVLLSGDRVLDNVESRIEKTLRTARFENGEIQADRRGENKKRQELQATLNQLDELLHRCDSDYMPGRLKELETKQQQLLKTQGILGEAKRFAAGRLDQRLRTLQKQRQSLPAEAVLGQLSQQMHEYEQALRDTKIDAQSLSGREQLIDDHEYVVRALATYDRVTSSLGTNRRPQSLLIGALLFVMLAIGGSIANWMPYSAVFGGVAAMLVAAALWMVHSAGRGDPGADAERVRLSDEFQRRFGEPLADRASLETRQHALQKAILVAETQAQQLQNDQAKLTETRNEINLRLSELMRQSVDQDLWRQSLDTLTRQREEVDREIDALNSQISDLGVPSAEYSQHDPGRDWDEPEFTRLASAAEAVAAEMQTVQERLSSLRHDVMQATHSETDLEWHQLLEALRTRRSEIAQEYREKTAEVLAKIFVHTVVKRHREDEMQRIRHRLGDQTVCQALQACTGRYVRLGMAEDEQLEVEDQAGDVFPVSWLSTGAKEQVYLALRIGFASRALAGRAGFLILDDAFQHSDWPKRKRLVDQCLSLVEQGWQVFYFAMDDHVRDLLATAGQTLGSRFTHTRLEPKPPVT